MNKKRLSLVMILGVLFLSACSNTQKALLEEISSQDIQKAKTNLGIVGSPQGEKIITLNAKKWEFDQTLIRAKVGEDLTIKINNLDGSHGIAIPVMQLVGDTQIQVDTSQPGEYTFQCLNYCGAGHSDMKGKLIIE